MKKLLSFILVALFAVTLSACNGGDEVPEDVINCVTNPELEECQEDDPTDDRTAEEIAADQVITSWDGDLQHLTLLMNEMQLDDSYEVVTNFEFEVEDGDETHYLYQSTTDQYVMVDNYSVVSRTMDINLDGEINSVQVIYEEVESGVVVYVDTGSLRDLILENNLDSEDVLITLGLEEDWVAFHFDDSLENIIQLEVLQEMMVEIMFGELGETYFYDMQTELETDLGFELEQYGIDIGQFVDYLAAEDYDAAELMLTSIDFDGLLSKLDEMYLVPELVEVLQAYELELSNAGLDIAPHVTELQTNGTESFFNNATDQEISILLDVIVDANNEDPMAPDFSELYDEYAAGNLENFIMVTLLSDPEVEMMLNEYMGATYYNELLTVVENIDFALLYDEASMWNEVLVAQLFDAVYNGQTAYNSYLTLLQSMMPETAAFLAPFEGVVIKLEPVFTDVEYMKNNMDALTQFVDLDYYMNNDLMTVDVEKTEDFEIETSMTMDSASYVELFDSVLSEVYGFVDGMGSMELPYVENVECPDGETCEPFDEYTEIVDALNGLESMDMTAIFDPSNPSEVLFNMDFAALMNSVIALDTSTENTLVVNTMTLDITMKDNTSITIPSNTSNANEIAEDFAKFSLMMEAYDYLNDAEYYFDEFMVGFTPGTYYFDEIEMIYPSLAFNTEVNTGSYVVVSGTEMNPEYAIQLVYRDGTNVFTEALDYDYIAGLVDTMAAPTRTAYLEAVGYVDETNFNMTKLFLIYLLQDDQYEMGKY